MLAFCLARVAAGKLASAQQPLGAAQPRGAAKVVVVSMVLLVSNSTAEKVSTVTVIRLLAAVEVVPDRREQTALRLTPVMAVTGYPRQLQVYLFIAEAEEVEGQTARLSAG